MATFQIAKNANWQGETLDKPLNHGWTQNI